MEQGILHTFQGIVFKELGNARVGPGSEGLPSYFGAYEAPDEPPSSWSQATLDAAASQARELREWFRRFVSDHAGKLLGPAALRDLAPSIALASQASLADPQSATVADRGGDWRPRLPKGLQPRAQTRRSDLHPVVL
jgi:hypothetical protein